MRLPISKVYRAFPELDPFTDAECERFVRRVRTGSIVARSWAAALGLLALWVFLALPLGVMSVRSFGLWPTTDTGSLLATFAVMLAIGTTVPVCGFLMRDRLLIRAIRRGVDNARCRACGQSLLGLPLMPGGGRETVRCTECGQVTLLDEIGVTHAELIPREPQAAE